MAIEKDNQCEPEFKEKLEAYQELKKQYNEKEFCASRLRYFSENINWK